MCLPLEGGKARAVCVCVCVCVCGGECGGVASCCPLGQAKCHFSTLFTQQSKERPCLAAQPLSQHPSSANCQGSERQRPGKQVQAHGLQVLRSTAFDVPGLAPAPPQVPLCLPWVPPSGPAPLPHSCPHKGHCQARFLAGEVDSVRWDPFFPSQEAWLREPGGGSPLRQMRRQVSEAVTGRLLGRTGREHCQDRRLEAAGNGAAARGLRTSCKVVTSFPGALGQAPPFHPHSQGRPPEQSPLRSSSCLS